MPHCSQHHDIPHAHEEDARLFSDLYGENVFNIKCMRDYLSEKTYQSLSATIFDGTTLDPSIADEVAEAMKNWAIGRGATHFTHWFQPLTGTTAEKHDSFIQPDNEGGVILQFSSKELIQGEPDASSFPSGGLRATFEARGYTVWDPTSPAFLKEGENSTTLCIPTIFFGYHGEALDKKTPLLRSIAALSKQICRLGNLFGVDTTHKHAHAVLGVEQEYFLIDKAFYENRLDLIQTGRTLFGKPPAKHQQMEDHYFGSIKKRVLAFMESLDEELWLLGIPAKTRHNEVAPAQFEIAPVFEELNLAIDHNMMAMQVMKEVAERHGFACLLHEKPFKGVNGSGKHNNWSVRGPDGKNWLKPGENPRENAKFLTMISAIMKAVDTHADILRSSVATPGNDHRLGANEAPPAIISIFMGDALTAVLELIEKGEAGDAKNGGTLNLGVSSLPDLPRDDTDRNRTSPFAFTGNKFEFRAVGSNQNCADGMTILNTIMADSLDEICTRLENEVKKGVDFNQALQKLVKETIIKHKRIIFNGDNYTEEWQKEAEKRGLPNVKKTPDALKALVTEKSLALFEKHKVLSRREMQSRHEVYQKNYEHVIHIEAECAATMAKTLILPAGIRYAKDLATTINELKSALYQGKDEKELTALKEMAQNIVRLNNVIIEWTSKIESDHHMSCAAALDAMLEIRQAVDTLETIVPSKLWPLPTYADMMLIM
jgi:glutamine synthetase